MAPVPVPLLGEGKRIHGTFAVALHEQSGALELTVMVAPATPVAATETFLVGTSRAQVSPDWVTLRDLLAIQSVAVRLAELGLGATEYVTSPVPLPTAPLLIVTQFV